MQWYLPFLPKYFALHGNALPMFGFHCVCIRICAHADACFITTGTYIDGRALTNTGVAEMENCHRMMQNTEALKRNQKQTIGWKHTFTATGI